MIQRPKNTDSMDDVLKMQEEFLKTKNEKPAADVVQKSRKATGKLNFTSIYDSKILLFLSFRRTKTVGVC
jgi:hypothetical protein